MYWTERTPIYAEKFINQYEIITCVKNTSFLLGRGEIMYCLKISRTCTFKAGCDRCESNKVNPVKSTVMHLIDGKVVSEFIAISKYSNK